jgi:hypothetical protein
MIASGVDLMDLYKRFGKILFKAQILGGQETIDRIQGKGKEKQLVDLVQEDRILWERLDRINNEGAQQQIQYRRVVQG